MLALDLFERHEVEFKDKNLAAAALHASFIPSSCRVRPIADEEEILANPKLKGSRYLSSSRYNGGIFPLPLGLGLVPIRRFF